MPHSHFELLAGILHCHTRITKKLENSLGALHGLGVSEYQVLYYLVDADHPISRIQLAEKIGLSASGITRMLQPMEKIGLITKQADQRDARLSLVAISGAGATKFAEAQQSFSNIMKELASNLTNSEQATLLRLSGKIA